MRLTSIQLLVVAAMLWWRSGGGVASAAAGTASSTTRAPRKGLTGVSGRPLIKGPAGSADVPLVYGYALERKYDHSPEAFTQGLEFDRSCRQAAGGKQECEDVLWESTGKTNEPSF